MSTSVDTKLLLEKISGREIAGVRFSKSGGVFLQADSDVCPFCGQAKLSFLEEHDMGGFLVNESVLCEECRFSQETYWMSSHIPEWCVKAHVL